MNSIIKKYYLFHEKIVSQLRNDDLFCFDKRPHMEWTRIPQNNSIVTPFVFIGIARGTSMGKYESFLNLKFLPKLIQRGPKINTPSRSNVFRQVFYLLRGSGADDTSPHSTIRMTWLDCGHLALNYINRKLLMTNLEIKNQAQGI